MHVLGKILAWITLPIAVTGFIFAAHLVDVRGRWLEQLQKVKTSNQDTTAKLAAARLEREQARAELERESLRWDRYWNDVVGNYIPRTGTLGVNVGSANVGGVAGITPNLMVYAFALDKKNAPAYVGAFAASQVQPNLTVLKPAFRVRAEDVPNWTAGNWRLRTLIPSSFVAQVAGLEADLVVADELLVKQQGNLETQNKLVNAARDQREERVAELLGGGKVNPPPPGLVAEITEADDQRNASLFEVDHLRREISTAEKNVRRLIQENNELARTLQSRLTPKLTAQADASN
jgi:hypothetical protein